MSEAKHSEGPWVRWTDHYFVYAGAIADNTTGEITGGFPICTMVEDSYLIDNPDDPDGDYIVDTERMEADMDLICGAVKAKEREEDMEGRIFDLEGRVASLVETIRHLRMYAKADIPTMHRLEYIEDSAQKAIEKAEKPFPWSEGPKSEV